ncbi:MAG TPA: septal ring lytic transglycosylase RlpA family protein [Thermoanaerobaculia bacterium]|jgi:3D (Asp-Asp-Asp) domain-containing protein|nr:septal ring lytic transglycosylase RlpA family protein [Thermoanaerobaculia bacterium]
MRDRPLQRSTTILPDRPSRLKLAGFVWVAALAFLAYLGVAIASGNQEGGPRLFGGFELPEDHAVIQLSHRPALGQASWYGSEFHGLATASGAAFDMNAMTAAHRTLPLGTRVLVRNLENDRKVVVEINDRGPYIAGRDIDLSYGAARALGMVAPGVVRVEMTPL